MDTRQEALRADSNQIELVDFRIFERQEDDSVYEGIYGINVSKVREILILPTLSRVPDAPDVIAGIFNLRGVQVPAVNLAKWLKLTEAPPEEIPRKVIVAEFNNQTIGLIIHQANRIRQIPWSDIKPPPILVSRRHGASIIGTTTLDDDSTLLLIDVERIVAEIQGQSVEEQIDTQIGDQQVAQHRGHILVVDDSSVARKQMSLTLKKGGYDVVEAADGQEAFGLLTRMASEAEAAGHAIGDDLLLVISDVEMPRMDGYSLVSMIKQDDHLRLLKVVLHSSLSGPANVDRALQAGCDEYMVKFDPRLLLETVEKLAGTQGSAGK